MIREQPFIPGAAFQYAAADSVDVNTNKCNDSNLGRPTTVSYTQTVQIIMPQHANSLGVTFGGYIIRVMERCAMVAASRHAITSQQDPVKLFFRTASIDSLNFLLPTHVGDIITVRAYVSRTFRTSLEVYVTVHARSPPADSSACLNLFSEYRMTNDGYMTIVTFGEQDNNSDYEQKTMVMVDHEECTFTGALLSPTDLPALPEVLPQTPAEVSRYQQAEERRLHRVQEKEELKRIYLSYIGLFKLPKLEYVCALFS